MRNGVLLALFIALAGSSTAMAMDTNTVIRADAALAQQQGIRADATARKGRYKDMDEAARNDLLAKQDVVFRLLEGKQSSDELTEAQRIELFSALEAIDVVVKNAKSEQLVCEVVRKTGSNRPTRVCRTRMAQDQERDETQKTLRSCSAPGCM
ncbi:hypothetical protein [Lysobacter tyrosinilyticus]